VSKRLSIRFWIAWNDGIQAWTLKSQKTFLQVAFVVQGVLWRALCSLVGYAILRISMTRLPVAYFPLSLGQARPIKSNSHLVFLPIIFNFLVSYIVVMGPGQKFLTRVGSGWVSQLWFGFEFQNSPLKITNFSIFFPSDQKIASGRVGKYPG